MDLYTLTSLEAGEGLLEARFSNIERGRTTLPLAEALGLKIVEDCISPEDLPLFNRSTVDGYAVRSKDTFGGSHTLGIPLKIRGKIPIGVNIEASLEAEETYEVVTGSLLPEAADSVVMVEYTQSLNEDEVLIYKGVHEYENVILKGEDIRKGQLLFPKGHTLRFQDIALLGAVGIPSIAVEKPLRIGVLSTGDEIVPADQKEISIGEIRDINGPLLVHRLKALDSVRPIYLGIVKDKKEALKQALLEGLETVDVILLSGGSSIGTKDYTLEIIEDLGEALFHGLPMKPGKPTIGGVIDDKLVMGLPGQPLSCYFVFEKMLVPLFKNGSYRSPRPSIKGVLTRNIMSVSGRLDCLPVLWEEGQVTPVLGKSGLLSPLGKGNGYIEIPFHKEGLATGTEVEVYLF